MGGLTKATTADPNLLVGFCTDDDAAVYRINDQVALVLTVDFFAPIVDDPFTYGAIAAANALSDVYAVGGRPLTALNVVAFPRTLPPQICADILRGGAEKVAEAGAIVVGGHTVDDVEPKYGLSVVGIVEPGKQVQNSTAQPGDVLVLTKPIGTGIISTALKSGMEIEQEVDAAVDSMSALNKNAAEAMVEAGAHAATDVTGFGIVGHLMTMMRSSGTTAALRRSALPVLPGAEDLLVQGVAPGGTHRNLESCEPHVEWETGLDENDKLLLCDPQTSGGLLISIAEDAVNDLIEGLKRLGVVASVVGEVGPPSREAVQVLV